MSRRLSDLSGHLCLAVFAALLAGCHRSEERGENSLAPLPAASEMLLSVQIEEVRAGRSEVIVLEETLVTDGDLEAIRGLATLRELTLRKTHLSDAAAALLSELSGLEKLVLGDTTFTDDSARRLARLSELRTLNINSTRFTSAALGGLAELSKLELLRLGASQIDDQGLVPLERLKDLKFLVIQNARLTDAGLEHLKPLTKLESLYVEGNQISSAGVERVFPNLHVHW